MNLVFVFYRRLSNGQKITSSFDATNFSSYFVAHSLRSKAMRFVRASSDKKLACLKSGTYFLTITYCFYLGKRNSLLYLCPAHLRWVSKWGISSVG